MTAPQQRTEGLTVVTARSNGRAEREAALDGGAAARAARVATLRRRTPQDGEAGRGMATLCGCKGVWLCLAVEMRGGPVVAAVVQTAAVLAAARKW
ncbi:DUF1998 domain-containing protein [Sesbania bispinosa]|nr:DUF1998 domain-containing protein [Sesbania bispinosa]